MAEATPHYISVHLTNRCDARCLHCRLWRQPVGREIDATALIRAMEEIAGWLGPREIQIAGGEPLLSTSLEALVAGAKHAGHAVTLTTNGFALTGDKAHALAQSRLDILMLSLDGFDHVHNRLRGRNDAFALAERAISHAADNGIKVRINCVLCEANRTILPGFVTWVRDHPQLDGIFFQALAQPFGEPPRDRWWEDESLFPEDREAMAATLDELLAMKQGGFPILNPDAQLPVLAAYFRDPDTFARRRCNVSTFGLTIGGDGAVHLCGRYPAIGHLADRVALPDMLRTPIADQVRAAMTACRENCHLLLNCCFFEGDGDDPA